MSYGSNGSVIGPENAPTASAASGVWSLGELAEARRDEIWPMPPDDWAFIAKHVADGTTASYDFTSIPQTYRDLRLVGSLARNVTSNSQVRFFIDIGSGIDTTLTNYGSEQVYGNSSAYGSFQLSRYTNRPGFFGDWPSNTAANTANSFIMDFHDYADSSKIASAILFQNGYKVDSASYFVMHGGWMHDPAGAIQGIRVEGETTTSNYYYSAPTTFSLFGRGTPD